MADIDHTKRGELPPGTFRIKRVFVEEHGEAAPLFANYAMVSRHGTDAYIDLGVIPLDPIREAPKDGELPEVEFHVMERVVMSFTTFTQLKMQMDALIASIIKEGSIEVKTFRGTVSQDLRETLSKAQPPSEEST